MTTRVAIYRDNDWSKKRRKNKDNAMLALIVATAVGLLAVKLYFLWFWPW